MQLSLSLAHEYLSLFSDATINPAYSTQVDNILSFVDRYSHRLKSASKHFSIPWYIAALVLVHDVPIEKLDWEWEIAIESTIENSILKSWNNWSLAGALFILEGFYTNWMYKLKNKLPSDIWGGTNYLLVGAFHRGIWFDTISPKTILGVVPLLKSFYESDLLSFSDVCSPACAGLTIGQGGIAIIRVLRMSCFMLSKDMTLEHFNQFNTYPIGTGNKFSLLSWKIEFTNSDLILCIELENPIAGNSFWYVKYSDVSFIFVDPGIN